MQAAAIGLYLGIEDESISHALELSMYHDHVQNVEGGSSRKMTVRSHDRKLEAVQNA